MADVAAALSIELVEISAPPPPVPAAAAAFPAPPQPAPPPPPTATQAVTPPPAEPAPPVPVQASMVPLTPAAAEPEPVREIVPMHPTPPSPELSVTPAVLREELKPADEVVPLRPAPPDVKPQVAPREKPAKVQPLRPAPSKPEAEPPPQMIVRAPAPRPVATPQVQAAKAPPAPKPPEVNVAEVVGEGRAFLKILEQGAGPGIEIRWPAESSQRDQLYGVLVQCLGMRTGLLDGTGRLYLAEGAKGQPSQLDGERYSGFVRRPEGAIARNEEREIGRVRDYHQVRATASPARIFPRRVDAYLIGGLRQFVGENYLKTKSIRAAYRLRNGRAVVDSIVADGRRIDGVIDLSGIASSCS